MTAPLIHDATVAIRLAGPRDRQAIGEFLAAHPDATPFHSPAWLEAVERATGHGALTLLACNGGEVAGVLPLNLVHSPLFGRALVSTGFAVGGGVLAASPRDAARLLAGAEELAARHSCHGIELRGGLLPERRAGWTLKGGAHASFAGLLAADDEAQLLAIPRKQRAEVRKALASNLHVSIGRGEQDRAMHHATYAASVHRLGTPVFPRALFDAVLDLFGECADILTVTAGGRPVASVLSLYHRGAVMPFWGGGAPAARTLRASELMYFALMRHARDRNCTRFDFGRSRTGSGPYHFKRNWGFEPQPLTYATWAASGTLPRDLDPGGHGAKVALWKRLPLPLANAIGPWIARGLA